MNIIVLRFSARGDVALVVPALREAVASDKKLNITFVSRPEHQAFFHGIERVEFLPIDLKNRGGIIGLWQFARFLKKRKSYEAVLDLHGVFRAWTLCFFLNLKTYRINKGRLEKEKLARRKNKILQPLKHSIQRYRDVFIEAGIAIKPGLSHYKITPLKTGIKPPTKKFKIGIAPTSRHHLKEWPFKNMRRLIELIKKQKKAEIFILGGPGEKNRLETNFGDLASIVAGKYSIEEDLEFMQNLDLIISMDSANMHVAALLGVPLISIWGPSHPFFGYLPLSKKSTVIQREDLGCRPCSINGNRPCFRKDHACMEGLTPETVYQEIITFI